MRRLLPLMLACLVLAAGCGSSDSEAGDQATDAGTPTPSATSTGLSAPGGAQSPPGASENPGFSGSAVPTTAPPKVPQATPKSKPTGTSQAARYCESLLSQQDVSTLAGVAMGKVTIQAVGTTPGCSWVPLKGGRITVAVVNANSSTWAQQIQQVADSVRSSGVTLSDDVERQLREAAAYVKRGQEVDADLACEIFGELATATGSGKDADATLRVTPSSDRPTAITAQVCNSDEYSFLQLNDPALKRDLDAKVSAVRASLQQLQGAPLSF